MSTTTKKNPKNSFVAVPSHSVLWLTRYPVNVEEKGSSTIKLSRPAKLAIHKSLPLGRAEIHQQGAFASLLLSFYLTVRMLLRSPRFFRVFAPPFPNPPLPTSRYDQMSFWWLWRECRSAKLGAMWRKNSGSLSLFRLWWMAFEWPVTQNFGFWGKDDISLLLS